MKRVLAPEPPEPQGPQGPQGPRFAIGQRVYWRRFGVVVEIDAYSRSQFPPPYRYWYSGTVVSERGAGSYATAVAEEEFTSF